MATYERSVKTFVIVLLLVFNFTQVNGQDYKCEDFVDLFLVTDASSAVGSSDNWNDVLQFLSDTMNYLSIKFSASSGIRVAIMTYDSEVNMVSTFYTGLRKLQTQILAQSLSQDISTSDTSAAIDGVVNANIRNDRPNAPNVAILVTSGSSSDKAATLQSAANAHGQDIDIITVGITSNVDEDEIRQMASTPRVQNQNYFLVSDFSQLSTMSEAVARGLCNRDLPAPSTEAPTTPKQTTVTTTTSTTVKVTTMAVPSDKPTAPQESTTVESPPTSLPTEAVQSSTASPGEPSTATPVSGTTEPNTKDIAILMIVLPIVCLILIIALIIIGFCCYRYFAKKNKKDKYKTEGTMQEKMELQSP